MIRNKSFLVCISLLLFGATFFIDSGHYYLDIEELIESIEVEREELKEGMEGRDWEKFSYGGDDYYINSHSFHFHQPTCFGEQIVSEQNTLANKKKVPLFIRYCCLKVNLR